jgi:hypothetical protein
MDEIRAAFRVADNPTLTFYAGACAAAAGVWSLAALGVTGIVSIVSQ